MTWLFKSRNGVIWFILVVATFFSFESAALADYRHISATVVLVLAFFKVWLIGLEFMELRHAPLPLRFAYEAWCVAVCGILLTLYWQAVPHVG